MTSQLDQDHDEGVVLFVYGTLKRGGCRSYLLQGQTFLGETLTMPQYQLFDLGEYPGLVAVESEGEEIEGELWRVDREKFIDLDREEGVDVGLYEFGPVQLRPPHDSLNAFAYFYLRDLSNAKRLTKRWEVRD